VENALGISGGQAMLITITIALTILGLAGLAAAIFMEKRFRATYSLEYVFIGGLLVMAFIGDWSSTGTYKASIAFQWGFAFITDDNKISRNAAVVKPGERVLFKIVSNDVIHGFNIPVANITAEIDPGDVRELWIRAPEKPGKYLIQCVNYCGVGHAQMKAWLVVDGEVPTAELNDGEITNGA
jgi:heme/copper-type cytochrome/quinol oxidase subunit 2